MLKFLSDVTMDNRQNLYRKMLRKYKFYLSFENALCQDYITEKFFLALHSGVIPIAYGGLSRQDYEKVRSGEAVNHKM